MSFYEILHTMDEQYMTDILMQAEASDVQRVLAGEVASPEDLAVLLSPAGAECLEEMAWKARELTLRHFGRAVVLYAPLYLANYCVNRCLYCGFNHSNAMDRRKLSSEELGCEAQKIAQTGIRHILLLTGESRVHTPVAYIEKCVRKAGEYFSSVSLEIYPLEEEEYRQLVAAGADGLTMYQETYDERVYEIMHPSGPKRDYRYRLDAPERGCRAGMRSVGVGALLGLADWRQDAFRTALHARYLSDRYPGVELSLSLPRMRPNGGALPVPFPVEDREFVQILLAFRIFLPYAGITMSTRERAGFRDHLMELGVTRMSAGSVTEVGGYRQKRGDGQFDVSDERSVEEIRRMLYDKGFQPVFQDWKHI